MYKRILGFSVLLFLMACSSHKNGESSTPQADTIPQIHSMQSLDGCYRMVILKDTAFLSLSGINENYQGELWYKRFEKDANRGTVSLTKTGDYLTGWYNFESEGRASVREIKLKILNQQLAEGFGDVALYGDTVKFKYPQNLEYETKNAFVKTSCIP